MESTPPFHVPRSPRETAKAYTAKCDYLGLGSGRSLTRLHELYLSQIETEAIPPSRNLLTIKRWSSRFGWAELALQYDHQIAEIQLAAEIARRRDAYREELKQFRDLHNSVGKGGFKSIAESVKKLVEFVDSGQPITTWAEAVQVSTLIRNILPISEWWAKSLAVDKLLETINLDD